MQRRSVLLAEGGVGEGIAVLARILADGVGEWRLVRVRVRVRTRAWAWVWVRGRVR